MGSQPVKTTEVIISCSDNGQHPLVYINLKNSKGSCHYCGQEFVRVDSESPATEKEAA